MRLLPLLSSMRMMLVSDVATSAEELRSIDTLLLTMAWTIARGHVPSSEPPAAERDAAALLALLGVGDAPPRPAARAMDPAERVELVRALALVVAVAYTPRPQRPTDASYLPDARNALLGVLHRIDRDPTT